MRGRYKSGALSSLTGTSYCTGVSGPGCCLICGYRDDPRQLYFLNTLSCTQSPHSMTYLTLPLLVQEGKEYFFHFPYHVSIVHGKIIPQEQHGRFKSWNHSCRAVLKEFLPRFHECIIVETTCRSHSHGHGWIEYTSTTAAASKEGRLRWCWRSVSLG